MWIKTSQAYGQYLGSLPPGVNQLGVAMGQATRLHLSVAVRLEWTLVQGLYSLL